MNHYANKVARGPGEGEDRGEGPELGAGACLRVASA